MSEDGNTDAKEASALGYRDSHIDVYSNSWGPLDFGFIVSGPGSLVQRTLETGVAQVRVTKYICNSCEIKREIKRNVIIIFIRW